MNFDRVVTDLTYKSYCHQRMMFPEVEPEKWALIFPNAAEMEARFVNQFVLCLLRAAAEEGETN